MENELRTPSPAPEGGEPRPRWQRWLAWIGIAVMVVWIIYSYVIIASGGL